MHTLRLNISDNIYDKIIWLLNKFDKSEIEVIQEDTIFKKNQEYLCRELNELDSEKTTFVGLDELNDSMDNVIKKYED